ncbi:MAG: AtpZ/AtpI family protein [Hyphomicrobium sp.]
MPSSEPPSGDNSEPGQGQISPEERAAFRRRAEQLGQKLDTAKAQHAPPPDQRARGAAYGKASKIAIELVVGILVGGFLGRVFDTYLGTAPWLMVLFLLLGFAAGLMNVIRTARRMQAEMEPLQRAAKPVRDDDDD